MNDGSVAAVEFHLDAGAFDRLDVPCPAVLDSGLLVGAGELDAIAGGERRAAMGGIKQAVLAELAAFTAHGAQGRIQPVHLVIGVGEDKARFRRICGTVLGPLLDQRSARLTLRAGPMDGAFLVVDAERVVKVAFGHHLRRAPLVDFVLALDFAQFGRAMAVLERAEHAAAIDARQLPVVADKDELGAGFVRMRRHHGHELGIEHGGFVHHDDGAPVPAGAPIVEPEELAMHGCGVAEAVATHVLCHRVCRGEPDHAIAGFFVGLADRGHGEAFAGAGLAVDDRQALFAGGVAEGAGLFARDPCELLAGEHAGPLAVADLVPALARQSLRPRATHAARLAARCAWCSG